MKLVIEMGTFRALVAIMRLWSCVKCWREQLEIEKRELEKFYSTTYARTLYSHIPAYEHSEFLISWTKCL